MLVAGLGTAAIARAALAQPDHAAALLAEIDSDPRQPRKPVNYPALLPALVRTALTTNNPQLAHQLTTGVEPHTPYHEHALAAATAALAEANGNPSRRRRVRRRRAGAGKPSVSSPSRPSPSSATAAASSRSAT